jgi:hypothetical protein
VGRFQSGNRTITALGAGGRRHRRRTAQALGALLPYALYDEGPFALKLRDRSAPIKLGRKAVKGDSDFEKSCAAATHAHHHGVIQKVENSTGENNCTA